MADGGLPQLENDLKAAIEVNLEGWQVVYPSRSVHVADGRSEVEIRLRDEPGVRGSCAVAAAMLASESFGSFGDKAREFLEQEQRELQREKNLALGRKQRDEAKIWEMRTKYWLDKDMLYLAVMWKAVMLGLLLLVSFDEGMWMPFAYLWSAAGGILAGFLSLTTCFYWHAMAEFKGRIRKALAAALVLSVGSLVGWLIWATWRNSEKGYWWCVFVLLASCMAPWLVLYCFQMLPGGRDFAALERAALQQEAERTIVFEGHVRRGNCICSWPGIYESAWDALVEGSRKGELSAAVVFLPAGSKHFGSHDPIPEEEGLPGACWCSALYGEAKPWRCRWWSKWIKNIEEARRLGAKMEVYYFSKKKGRGKVQSFETAGQEHLRRDAISAKKQLFLESKAFQQAVDAGLDALSTQKGADSSSQYSRELHRLFLEWLPEDERAVLQCSEGLGNSQKAEVAWLERKGYEYTELEVDVSHWVEPQVVVPIDQSPKVIGHEEVQKVAMCFIGSSERPSEVMERAATASTRSEGAKGLAVGSLP